MVSKDKGVEYVDPVMPWSFLGPTRPIADWAPKLLFAFMERTYAE